MPSSPGPAAEHTTASALGASAPRSSVTPNYCTPLAQFLQKFTAFFCVFHLGLGLVQPVAASRRALDLDNGDRRSHKWQSLVQSLPPNENFRPDF